MHNRKLIKVTKGKFPLLGSNIIFLIYPYMFGMSDQQTPLYWAKMKYCLHDPTIRPGLF